MTGVDEILHHSPLTQLRRIVLLRIDAQRRISGELDRPDEGEGQTGILIVQHLGRHGDDLGDMAHGL